MVFIWCDGFADLVVAVCWVMVVVWCVDGLGCCWFDLIACMRIVGLVGIIAFCLDACLLCDLIVAGVYVGCWT